MRIEPSTAPDPLAHCIEHVLPLPAMTQSVLAMGAWFKNSLCMTSPGIAQVSPLIGDLDAAETCLAHEKMAYALLEISGEKLCAIAHDLHPDFYSSRFALKLATELQVPLIAVQHHHAHIAAICAEHNVKQAVLGVALDGVGMGSDGLPWGGELLLVDGAKFHRLGHLRTLPLPGGDTAAREPWRMAAAALHALGRSDEILQRFPNRAAAKVVLAMLERNVNCPRTSSMGRLFDAAAGLLGLCDKMQFEAQAAVLLEVTAKKYGDVPPLMGGYILDARNVLDFSPLLAILADCHDTDYGAALFHATLTDGLAQWVKRVARTLHVDKVALGGGCFLNRVLAQSLQSTLSAQGLAVLMSKKLPPGDSAISLGQAWVASHQIEEEISHVPCNSCAD